MSRTSTPPSVARWLLEHALPDDVREPISGDLAEVFQRDCRNHGPAGARWRYWRQVMSFTMHFVAERWRERRRGGLMRLGLSWLDFKLGLRMLVRYPMLTIVGSLAMAVAIAVGAGTFEVITLVTNPSLPLPDGDRIVALNYWDRADSGARPASAYDVINWREGLRTIEDVGAFRLMQRNLIAGEQYGEPVQAAEISAAAFKVTGVPALIGRGLVEEDESLQAPAVVVLGHRLWKTRFSADPGVIGRVVRLGATQATVVGVMPEGFAFPVRQNLWTPLRLRELSQEPGQSEVRAFGRLARGVELSEAQAELTTLGARIAQQFPKQYENLQPQVAPYAESFFALPQDFLVRAGIHSINAFGALFLVVVCGNVALLMFARAATREREIVVRRALGAGRGRIVMQLFAEALVLAAIAAAIGLAATDFGLKWVIDALSSDDSDGWPFWIQGGLSASTVAYSAGLTVLAAIVAGAFPALKITRKNMEAGLRQASAGAGGIRMGGIWTGVIVAQIAGTVLFTAVAYVVQRQAAGLAASKAAFPAEQYLAVRLDMDQDSPQSGQQPGQQAGTLDEAFLRRYEATARELDRRVAAEPSIAGVTLADRLPMMASGAGAIEFDDAGSIAPATAPPAAVPAEERRIVTTTAAVDLDFFQVFQTPVLAGRSFTPHDTAASANTVVVNHLFVEQILAGRNAIGRRVRYKVKDPEAKPGPWFEIIGVVRDLVPAADAPLSLDNPARPVVYHTLGAKGAPTYPLYLATHARSGDATSVLPTLRRIAAGIGPELRLTDVQRLDQGTSSDVNAWNGFANFILLVSAIALVLSLAGIYAITSFTVSRRMREIAIRVALGAQIPTIMVNVFRAPFFQVAAGVAVGCLMMGSLVVMSTKNASGQANTITSHAGLLLAYGSMMIGVCALACIGPLLRVLRVDPTDVLRDDG